MTPPCSGSSSCAASASAEGTHSVTLIPERRGRDPLRPEFRRALSDAGVRWIDLHSLATDDHYLEGDGTWNAAGRRCSSPAPAIRRTVAGSPSGPGPRGLPTSAPAQPSELRKASSRASNRARSTTMFAF